MTTGLLTKLLKTSSGSAGGTRETFKKDLDKLQLRMLTIQQGIWHQKKRAIIVFEGFDAAGKGGAIRKITEVLDPRGVRVHPIGPPSEIEQGKHWLYRFWKKLPEPGTIAIFDRSWYGRVLIERVEGLAKRKHLNRAYSEINQFEKILQDDGISLIKIFLAISKDEQLKRFESRLKDPYKHWKLSKDDLHAREKWGEYVKAADQMFYRTNTRSAPWKLITANNKHFTRRKVLTSVTNDLRELEFWMKKEASRLGKRSLAQALREIDERE